MMMENLQLPHGILFTLPVDEEGVDDDRPASYHIGAACAPADNEVRRDEARCRLCRSQKRFLRI